MSDVSVRVVARVNSIDGRKEVRRILSKRFGDWPAEIFVDLDQIDADGYAFRVDYKKLDVSRRFLTIGTSLVTNPKRPTNRVVEDLLKADWKEIACQDRPVQGNGYGRTRR